MEFVYPETQPEVNIPRVRPEIEPRRLMGMAFSKIRQALELFERVPPQYRGGNVEELIGVLEKYTR